MLQEGSLGDELAVLNSIVVKVITSGIGSSLNRGYSTFHLTRAAVGGR